MIGDNYAAQVLNSLLGSGTPANLWWGWGSSSFTSSGGGTEVSTSGTGYSRILLPNTTTEWPAATGNQKTNAVALVWPAATGIWAAGANITTIAAWSNSTGGAIVLAYDLVTPKPVGIGDAPKIDIGKFLQMIQS